MANVERKRVTLHPVKEDGTIDTNVNLYPKTLVDGIVDRNGELVDVALKSDLNTEADILDNKIESIGSEITDIHSEVDNVLHRQETVENTVNELSQQVISEVTEREAGDLALSQKIAVEKERATIKETNLTNKLTTLEQNLNTEKTSRCVVDNNLLELINNETTRATGVEANLSGKLDNEITNRELAIDEVQAAIATESTRAQNIESSLASQLNITNTQLTEETQNRAAADTILQTAITAEIDRATNIENSIRTDLSSISSQLTTEIATEIATRQSADTDLQNQINTIESRADVVDVVATKADLNNYDTTKLTNNDVVKVLVDESNGNKTTYYRWVITISGRWVFVGAIGPYSTATNVTNGNNGSAEVSFVSSSENSITNKGYVDTAISESEARTEAWEQELENMLNLRLTDIDENLEKLYYCNVFLKDFSVNYCYGIKYDSGHFSTEGTTYPDRIAKGNTIQSISFNVAYNKLPLGCKLYLKNLTDNIEYSPIDATVDGRAVLTYNINSLSLTKTTEWQLILKSDYDGSISQKTITIYVCNKVYWGLTTLTSGEITNPEWDSELSYTFATNKPVLSENNKFIVYAFPVADAEGIDYGIPMFTLSPSQFVGGVGQYIQGSTTTFSFTNTDNNYSENYYIYITDNNNLGDVTIKVEKQ